MTEKISFVDRIKGRGKETEPEMPKKAVYPTQQPSTTYHAQQNFPNYPYSTITPEEHARLDKELGI